MNYTSPLHGKFPGLSDRIDSGGSLPVFDLVLLDQLFGKVPEDLVHLFGELFAELSDLPASWRELVAKADWAGLVLEAHRMKGACATFGLSEVARFADSIRRQAKDTQNEELALAEITVFEQSIEKAFEGIRLLRPDYLPECLR